MRSRKAQERHDHGYFDTVSSGTATDPVSSVGNALLDDNTWGAVGGGGVGMPTRDVLFFKVVPGVSHSGPLLVYTEAGAAMGGGSTVSIAAGPTGSPRLQRSATAGNVMGMYHPRYIVLDDLPDGDFVWVFGIGTVNATARAWLGFNTAAPSGLSSGDPSSSVTTGIGLSFDAAGDWNWHDGSTTTATGLTADSDSKYKLTMTWDGSTMTATFQNLTSASAVEEYTYTTPPTGALTRFYYYVYGGSATVSLHYHRTEWAVEW